MKKNFLDYFYLLAFAGAIIAVDQWTKHLVRANLGFSEMWSPWPWLMPYARLVHWQNTGAAFGMFQGMSLVFTILAILVSAAILYYYPQTSRQDWPMRVAMGMMLAGALGNLIDRLTLNGVVTDFISVGNFAVFNVADASISVGVVVLIAGMWIQERQEKAAQQAAQTPPTGSTAAQPREDTQGD